VTTVLGSLAESVSTSSRIKVADISVVDDALGTNVLSLDGVDASLFELDGAALFLKAGVALDYGVKSSYDVKVRVIDTTAVDRLAETPLTVLYDPSTGRLKLVNTTGGALAIQSAGLASPTRVLSGVAASLPQATVTTSNTDPQGVHGQGSEIFFANFGTAALTLAAGASWDYGPVMTTGLGASALASGFATDADADPQNVSASGRFLYSLIVSGAGGPTTRGAIIRDVAAGFTLNVANVPEYSGREYVEIAAGQEFVATSSRSGARQIIARGSGRVILDAANTHTGGVLVEAGELVIRNPAAIGSGRLEVRSGAKVTLDTGTSRVTVPQLIMPTGGILEVGRGGITVAAGGYDPAELRQRLQAGRNAGQWNGTGIRSGNATAGSYRAVGYRVLADGSAVLGWGGFGDTNLDGRVNSSDINMILASGRFGTSATDGGWWQGDFNYDGRVNSQDLNLMLAAGLINAGSYLPAAGGGSGTSSFITGVSPSTVASWTAGLFASATTSTSVGSNVTTPTTAVGVSSRGALETPIPVLVTTTKLWSGQGAAGAQQWPTVEQAKPTVVEPAVSNAAPSAGLAWAALGHQDGTNPSNRRKISFGGLSR
jgi:autotransporter-associated beta strand protein